MATSIAGMTPVFLELLHKIIVVTKDSSIHQQKGFNHEKEISINIKRSDDASHHHGGVYDHFYLL